MCQTTGELGELNAGSGETIQTRSSWESLQAGRSGSVGYDKALEIKYAKMYCVSESVYLASTPIIRVEFGVV